MASTARNLQNRPDGRALTVRMLKEAPITLALAIVTKDLALVAADRRYYLGADQTFDGVKMCRLITPDAAGLIVYAGIGARMTAERLQLSE